MWSKVKKINQEKVIAELRLLAEEALDDDVHEACVAAIMELELWMNPMDQDPYNFWILENQHVLSPYQGQHVLIHLTKGIVAHGKTQKEFGLSVKIYMCQCDDADGCLTTYVPTDEELDAELAEDYVAQSVFNPWDEE